MNVKLLTEHLLEVLSLTGGCIDSSESTLVKMSNCWKSHATAHYYLTFLLINLFIIGPMLRWQVLPSNQEGQRTPPLQKGHMCTHCGKQCKSRWHKETHERIHTGAKPFPCELCGKAFNVKGNLKAHMITHYNSQ